MKVFDSPEVNAIALPGGHVALFRGLIEQARSSDEIAATMAHEIEHVARQHPNENILRTSGPAVVARTLDSDAGKLADLTVLKRAQRPQRRRPTQVRSPCLVQPISRPGQPPTSSNGRQSRAASSTRAIRPTLPGQRSSPAPQNLAQHRRLMRKIRRLYG
ncbi:M48 family metalloprotease [Sphingomonas sp. MMS24-JH45]